MLINRILMATAIAASFSIAPAFAFPGGGSSEKSNTTKVETIKPSAKKIKCKRSETAKRLRRGGKLKWVCVKLKAGIMPDAELYNQARLLADAGEYEWALDHLKLITNQNDAEVLNYTGYANRKAGRLETGIAYYQQALTINPNYVQAREYLGEAYVLAGLTSQAQTQLDEIEKRCGKTCKTYVALQTFMQQ